MTWHDMTWHEIKKHKKHTYSTYHVPYTIPYHTIPCHAIPFRSIPIPHYYITLHYHCMIVPYIHSSIHPSVHPYLPTYVRTYRQYISLSLFLSLSLPPHVFFGWQPRWWHTLRPSLHLCQHCMLDCRASLRDRMRIWTVPSRGFCRIQRPLWFLMWG